jgi:hypothetical protein
MAAQALRLQADSLCLAACGCPQASPHATLLTRHTPPLLLKTTHRKQHFCHVGILLPHNPLSSKLDGFALHAAAPQLQGVQR